MPNEPPRIELTPPELDIMQILWSAGRITARDVREELQKRGKTSQPSTVATHLERLRVIKHYVDRAMGAGREYEYFPVILKEQFLQQAVQDTAALFDSEGDFLHGFAGASELSEKDKRELRRLADQIQRKLR